jgi:predicted nucleic-acid-binding Zn-ribbon protein
MTCEICGAALTPGEQECPCCGAKIKEAVKGQFDRFTEVTCDICGYYPVVIPEGGWGDCPGCGKSYC